MWRIWILVLLGLFLEGCNESPVNRGANVASKTLHEAKAICDDNILFTNNSSQLFIIKKIIREDKLSGAILKIENTILWEYRGHQTSRNIHNIDRKLVINEGESVICDHEGHLMIILGYFTDSISE